MGYHKGPRGKGMVVVLIVYQCNINVMVSLGGNGRFFVKQGSRCVRMLETCPLLHINLSQYYLTLAWFVAGFHTLWHSTDKCLYYLLAGILYLYNDFSSGLFKNFMYSISVSKYMVYCKLNTILKVNNLRIYFI